MTLRRLVPLLVGVVALAAAVTAILAFGDDRALDGGTGPTGPEREPLAEPSGDGTYRCSPTGARDAPRLSAPAGFHDEPFQLELVADDDHPLYYTLDGSYPDPVGNADATQRYEDPLLIAQDDDPKPLTHRRSAFDRGQLAQRRSAPLVWDVSHGPVPGGTVVRARAIPDDAPTVTYAPGDLAGASGLADPDDEDDVGDLDGLEVADDGGAPPPEPAAVERAAPTSECVAVFFVGDELVRSTLPVLHLATDADHLFDHETGIYLPGQRFDDYLASDDFDAQWAEQFGLVPSNYRERGRAWERPFQHDLDDAVVVHHFEPGGEASYVTNLGIRIHGGWSRAFPQKSLRLYARNDYGHRTFDHAFFGDAGPDVHRRLMLRNSGNDWDWTLLLDGFVQSLIADWDVETQAFQPAVLFINGEYWGIHNLRERYDRHYLEIAHGVDPDNVAIITGYGPCCEVNTGEPGDDEPYRELLLALAEMDPTDAATLAYVEERMDVDDLIEYLVIQLFISNTDWPQNNLKLWREKVEPDPQLGTVRDGRWRFLVYDLDFVGDIRRDHFHDAFARLGGMVDESDVLGDLGIPFLFDRLSQNEAFRERFATRFADATNTHLRAEHATARLDELTELLRDEIELHARRWGNSSVSGWWPFDSSEAWWGRIVEVRTYFSERPGIARHQASEFLGLGGRATLNVRTTGADHGHVVVNLVEVVDGTPGVEDPADWTGRYFPDVPVTVRAVPADGYRFVRFDGAPPSVDATADEFVLHLDDDETTLTAVFEPA